MSKITNEQLEAGEKLALWAYEEVNADPELTPGLHDMLNMTGHHKAEGKRNGTEATS